MEALEKDAAKAARTLPKAANGIKKTGRAAATATTNVQRLGVAFRTTLLPITAVLGSLALLNKALGVVGQRDAELNVLSTGLRGLVDDADAAANALVGAADKLGKQTLFDQEDFTATFKLFTSFRNIGVDAYERVGEAAADIATKLGTAPKEAALQLAKALEDPAKQVTALARSGTVFTDQQKEQIKTLQQSGDLLGAQEIILKEIEKQYGGAAKAAGSAGFAGALDSTGEAWRDFLETLGESNQSGAVEFLNGVTKALEFLTRNFDVIAQAARATVDVLLLPFKAMHEGITSVIGPVENFEATFRQAMAITTKVLTDLTQNVLVPAFRFVGVVIGTIGKWLGQLIVAIGNTANSAVQFVVGAINKIAGVIAAFINQTPQGILLKLFGIDAGGAAAAGLKNFAAGIDGVSVSVKGYKDALLEAGSAALTVEGDGPGVSNPFAGAGPKGANAAGGGGKSGGGKSGADKAAKDAEKLAQKTAERVLSAEKLINAAQRESEILNANSEFEKAQIESMNTKMEIAEKYGELAAQSLSDEETNLLLQAQGLEIQNERVALAEKEAKAIKSATQPLLDQQQFLQEAITLGREEATIRQAIRQAMEGLPETERARVESLIRGNQALEDQLSTMDQMKDLAGSISDTIENGLVNALGTAVEGLITGAEDLDESLKKILQGVLKDIANQMIKAGISSLFQSIGGGGGGGIFGGLFRAEGGPVKGGQSYVVGEKGPEIFTPGLTGNITSNEDSRAAMANYSGGNASAAGAMAPMAANVTYSGPTLNFNGDDYIPRSEANNLVAAGAKQGQARTLATLKNSRAQRSKLGM